MRRNKAKRISAAIVSLLCVVALGVGTTYAFQSMSQRGWGQALIDEMMPGGRVHIDQEVMGGNFGQQRWRVGMQANHDVYVENFDEVPIFARVRLSEYLEYGGDAGLHPNDPGFDDRDVTPLIEGAVRTDTDTWTIVLPNPEPDTDSYMFRMYSELEQSGGSKWFMPTFNRDINSAEPDVKGDAWAEIPILPELPNSTRRGLPHAIVDDNPYLTDQPFAFPLEAGLRDWWSPEQNNGSPGTHSATRKIFDAETNQHTMETYLTEHTARKTLDATIMTMDEWKEIRKLGNFWVLDADGWAYWAAPIEPGDATGMLLNSFIFRRIPPDGGTVYYGIYVDAELVTIEQLADLSHHPMSKDAEDLVNVIMNDVFLTIIPPAALVYPGSVPQEFEVSAQLGMAVESTADVTWSIVNPRYNENKEFAPGTEIVGTGSRATLHVAANELQPVIIVRATHPSGASKDVRVVVVNIYSLAELPIGTRVADPNGVMWRVLGRDDDKNTLIITEHVYHFGVRFDTGGSWIPWVDLTDQTIRTTMDNFWNNSLHTSLREYAMPVGNLQNNNRPRPTAGGWDVNENVASDRTYPIPGERATARNALFVLSYSEANHYFSGNTDRIGRNTGSTAQQWWLRSPGNEDRYPASLVGSDGALHSGGANATTRGIRPALWVSPLT